MLADILGTPAEIATILGALVVVGGIVLARTSKFRAGRRDAATVTELVVGKPAKMLNGVEVEPAVLGLSARQDTVERTLGEVVTHLSDIDLRLTPNGLNTSNPGDVLARTEAQTHANAKLLARIAQHLEIEPDGD